MNTELFLQCCGMGLLGLLLHVLIKYRSLLNRAKAANSAIGFGVFIKNEIIGICISFVVLVMFVIGFDELANYKPVVLNGAKWLFSFVGYAGSSVLLSFFSKSEKALLKVIDKKTNIADSKE